MRVLTLTGDHPRHLNLVALLSSKFSTHSVIMGREEMMPNSPQPDSSLSKHHFLIREQVEESWFGGARANDFVTNKIDSLQLAKGDIGMSDIELKMFDACVIFGTRLIPPNLMRKLPDMTLNLHLGISPRYRGAATLFWPFYMLEPNWAGFTIHKLSSEPDRGDILMRKAAQLETGQRLHDVAASVTRDGISGMLESIVAYESGKKLSFHSQKTSGKNWLSSDFSERHLKLVYQVYEDRIVDEYLSGNLGEIRDPVEISLNATNNGEL